jgi:peptidoglycan/LPS O-acetylase OafA/YrhL
MAILDSPLSKKRSYGIDVLRGILALWVLFSHLESWTRITQGEQAVPVFLHWIMGASARIFQPHGETNPAVLGFIVLSGYCIHRNGLRGPDDDIAVYFTRRFFRIYPIYVLAVLWGLLCFTLSVEVSPGLARTLSGTSSLSLWYVGAKLAGLSDIIPWMHAFTFQGNAPLHTVMVEIWLYALYPVLIFFAIRRYSEKAFWVIAMGIWGGGILLMSIHPGLSGWWHNGSILGFLLYWWIGAKFTDPDFYPGVYRYRYLLVMVWILGMGLGIPLVIEFRKAAFALLFGLVITKCDSIADGRRFGLERIGKAGYSLYALHAPLVYTLLLLGTPWYLVALSAILLGLLVFRVYENPLNQLGRRLASGA